MHAGTCTQIQSQRVTVIGQTKNVSLARGLLSQGEAVEHQSRTDALSERKWQEDKCYWDTPPTHFGSFWPKL